MNDCYRYLLLLVCATACQHAAEHRRLLQASEDQGCHSRHPQDGGKIKNELRNMGNVWHLSRNALDR